MTPPLLLHIGYHKTATTWMQKRLFVPAHGYRQLADHTEVFAHVVRPHGLRFDARALEDVIRTRSAALPADEVPVISSEILSGHPFQGGHESDVYAERLAQIAPGARILISIRSQIRILPSVYMQYVLRGGTMPHERFFEGTQEIGYFGFTPEHFEYDRLVALYQQLFGARNVHVMTQESLMTDMEAACSGLAHFARNDLYKGLNPEALRVQSPSYPEYLAPVLRRINHVQSSTLNPTPILALGHTPGGLYRAIGYVLRQPPFKTLLGHRKPVSDFVKHKFAGRFTESNARLAALLGDRPDLSGYT